MKIEENANPSTDISKNNQNKAENDNSEIKENTNGNIDVGSTKAGLL
jgi:hypothetical protein